MSAHDDSERMGSFGWNSEPDGWDGTSPSSTSPATSPDAGAVDERTVQEMTQVAHDVLSATQGVVSGLEQHDVALSEILEYLAQSPEGGAWTWKCLDPYETVALMSELREWVDWFTGRYELRGTIKPCWFRHGPVIEELTGLYVAWRAVFKEQPRAYTEEIIAWHDRWLWPLVRRTNEFGWMKNCTANGHKEPSTYATATNQEWFDAALGDTMQGVEPGADAEAIHAAINDGDAQPLRDPRKDPMTPVLWRGAWWAILGNSPDGLWVPRSERVGQKLQDLYEETHAGDNSR